MFSRAFLLPPLALSLALSLGACGDAVEVQTSTASNPTPLQEVQTILDRAAGFPAAGDDLTMYIGKRFAETNEPSPILRVSRLSRTD